MALLLGLTAISTAVANKGLIVVKPGYTEPLQIWTASVAPPGSRKSPVFGHMMRPIQQYESEQEREYHDQQQQNLDKREIVEGALAEAKKEATKQRYENQTNQEAIGKIAVLRRELRDLQVPRPDVITVSDITPERLGQRMAEHYGRAAILSPEGDIFSIMAGLYSDSGANFHVFKKGWTGNEAISDDRITREGTRVERPALVVGLTVQPTVLSELRGKTRFRGEGLLGRFVFAQPEDRIGYRRTGDNVPPLDEDARERYSESLRLLLEAGPHDEEGDTWIPHELPLSSDAAEHRNAFDAEIERMLRPGEDLDGIEDWGSKLVGNTVRLAGLIHLGWQVEEGDALWDEPVGARSMDAAISLARELIPHARRVFDHMDADPRIHLARYVLRRIATYEGAEPLTRRELHRRCQGKKEIQGVSDLDEPLEVLTKHNLIRETFQTSTGGRPPSPIIERNPRVPDRIDRSDTSRRPPAAPSAASSEADSSSD